MLSTVSNGAPTGHRVTLSAGQFEQVAETITEWTAALLGVSVDVDARVRVMANPVLPSGLVWR